MTTFNYTHTVDHGFSSSVVDEFYYNANDKQLLVDLNDSLYIYHNVSIGVFEAFKAADSKGTYYATYIKGTYGPATPMGGYGDVSYKRVSSPAKQTVRPSWERERDSTGRFVSTKPAPLASVGTNIDQYSVNADSLVADQISYLTNAPAEAKKFSLSSVKDDGKTTVSVSQRYSVKFVINGVDKTHNLNALSVDDAVAELTKSADALGLGIKVKEVTVYFD